jgi:hypothetical protein
MRTLRQDIPPVGKDQKGDPFDRSLHCAGDRSFLGIGADLWHLYTEQCRGIRNRNPR